MKSSSSSLGLAARMPVPFPAVLPLRRSLARLVKEKPAARNEPDRGRLRFQEAREKSRPPAAQIKSRRKKYRHHHGPLEKPEKDGKKAAKKKKRNSRRRSLGREGPLDSRGRSRDPNGNKRHANRFLDILTQCTVKLEQRERLSMPFLHRCVIEESCGCAQLLLVVGDVGVARASSRARRAAKLAAVYMVTPVEETVCRVAVSDFGVDSVRNSSSETGLVPVLGISVPALTRVRALFLPNTAL